MGGLSYRHVISRHARLLASLLAVGWAHGARAQATAAATEIPDLSPLSIEELANLEITSVSKKAQPVSAAPAAVYVITPDQIRRAGAITIPEALELAPNLIVRQVDPGRYG